MASNNDTADHVDNQDRFRHFFWNKIQNALGVGIPEYLKNILKYNNLDNPLSFRDITDGIVKDLEDFPKTSLLELIQEEVDVDMKSYFGIYHKKPSNFRFVVGDKLLIKKMVDFIKTTPINYWSTKTCDESQDKSSTNNNCKKQESILFKRITQGEKKFADMMEPTTVALLKNVRINVTFEGTKFIAEIFCPICNHVSLVTKFIDNERKPMWIISNFYKHFKKHAKKETSQNKEIINHNSTTGKKEAR